MNHTLVILVTLIDALLNHVPCNLKPERMLHVTVKVTSGNLQCKILSLWRTLRFHVKIFPEGSGFRLIFPWDFRHQNIPLESISKILSGSREHDLAKCPIFYLCVLYNKPIHLIARHVPYHFSKRASGYSVSQYLCRIIWCCCMTESIFLRRRVFLFIGRLLSLPWK